jgi:hypothetical protein
MILDLDMAQKYFGESKRYGVAVREAAAYDGMGMPSKAEEILESLPNDKALFEELLGKLKGKSVYTNLTQMTENRGWVALKAWSSLMTHALIECEHGNTEYMMIVHQIYEAIGRLITE